jgi:hypothetical protein
MGDSQPGMNIHLRENEEGQRRWRKMTALEENDGG